MTAGGPLICVGVPVWNGADIVGETLESVLRQRDVQLAVFISVDGADTLSAEACRPFLSDPRVRLAIQPERLGWVRNSADHYVALSRSYLAQGIGGTSEQ